MNVLLHVFYIGNFCVREILNLSLTTPSSIKLSPKQSATWLIAKSSHTGSSHLPLRPGWRLTWTMNSHERRSLPFECGHEQLIRTAGPQQLVGKGKAFKAVGRVPASVGPVLRFESRAPRPGSHHAPGSLIQTQRCCSCRCPSPTYTNRRDVKAQSLVEAVDRC